MKKYSKWQFYGCLHFLQFLAIRITILQKCLHIFDQNGSKCTYKLIFFTRTLPEQPFLNYSKKYTKFTKIRKISVCSRCPIFLYIKKIIQQKVNSFIYILTYQDQNSDKKKFFCRHIMLLFIYPIENNKSYVGKYGKEGLLFGWVIRSES